MTVEAISFRNPVAVTQAYAGGVYDPINNYIWFVPYYQAAQSFWYYIDCATGIFTPYEHGTGISITKPYFDGCYDPINQRIYFSPYYQSPEKYWHYIDCATKTVVAYENNALAYSIAYQGCAYDSNKQRIYLVPYYQSSFYFWHYIDCAAGGTVVAYNHGITSTVPSYCGAAYDPVNKYIFFLPTDLTVAVTELHYIKCTTGAIKSYANAVTSTVSYRGGYYNSSFNRIYLVPYGGASFGAWNRIDTSGPVVDSYVHGATVVNDGYFGCVYDSDNHRLYLCPYQQSDEANLHYIDFATGVVTAYPNLASRPVNYAYYYGGAYDPTSHRVYFSPNNQNTQTLLHGVDCAGGNSDFTAYPTSYAKGSYVEGIHDPINDRIYYAPLTQGSYGYFHYTDCATGNTVAYPATFPEAIDWAYAGAIYDPVNDRVYYVPGWTGGAEYWHYLDCAKNALVAYKHGVTIVEGAYWNGCYDPVLQRIYFNPAEQAVEPQWHYVDCAAGGTIVAYTHGITLPAWPYGDCTYDPVLQRIYFSPATNAPSATWHYIACATGVVTPYVHGATIAGADAYWGSVYDPVNQRIYFSPARQSGELNWHYIACATGVVTAYAHGTGIAAWAYNGGAYDSINQRIYFSPDAICTAATWHYVDCAAAGAIVPYVHGGVGIVANAFEDCTYDVTNGRVWFIPEAQATQTNWFYLDCATNTAIPYAHGTGITTGYQLGCYASSTNKIYWGPCGNSDNQVWHGIDCTAAAVFAYAHWTDVVSSAYYGGVYDPINERIYFVPYAMGQTSSYKNWHYVDCNTGRLVAYTHNVTAVYQAYNGGAYDPILQRIYFVPAKQSLQALWHYIDCAANGTVVAYAHGATVVDWSYKFAVYDATNQRIWLCPNYQTATTPWHYIACATGVVTPYAHGFTLTGFFYDGGVYDPILDRIYFIPISTAQADWHYVNCATATVVAYTHGVTSLVAQGYFGGTYCAAWGRIYPTPYAQADESEWHYIDCATGTWVAFEPEALPVPDNNGYFGSSYFDPGLERLYLPPYAQTDEDDWHYLADVPPAPTPPSPTPPGPKPVVTTTSTRTYLKAHFEIPTTVESLFFDGTVLLAGDPTLGVVHVWLHDPCGSWMRSTITGDPLESFGKLVSYGTDEVIISAPNAAPNGCFYVDRSPIQYIDAVGTDFLRISRGFEGSYSYNHYWHADNSQVLTDYNNWYGWRTQILSGMGVINGIDVGYFWGVVGGDESFIYIYKAEPYLNPYKNWVLHQTITEQNTSVFIFNDTTIIYEHAQVIGATTIYSFTICTYNADLDLWIKGETFTGYKFGTYIMNRIFATDSFNSGRIWIFEYAFGAWTLTGYLTEAVTDYGSVIDGEGNSIAVLSSGHVHVYNFDTYTDSGRILAGEIGDSFCRTLATDGTRVLATSDWEDSFVVLKKTDGRWGVEQRVHNSNMVNVSAGAIYGNYIVVCYYDGVLHTDRLAVFNNGTGTWVEQYSINGYAERKIIIGDDFFIHSQYALAQVRSLEDGLYIASLSYGPAMDYDPDSGYVIIGWETYNATSQGHAIVWRNIIGVWTLIAHIDVPDYSIKFAEFGQSVAINNGWIAIGCSDTRICMYTIANDVVTYQQTLYGDHSLWGVAWQVHLDRNRLYVAMSGGDLEVSGPAMVWEKGLDNVWRFKQHLRSSDFFYDSCGATEIVGVGDDIISGTIYYYTPLKSARGSIVYWTLCEFQANGRLQISSSVENQRMGSAVAVSYDWLIACITDGINDAAHIFKNYDGAWIQSGAIYIDANNLGGTYTDDVITLSPGIGEVGFGSVAAAASEWVAIGSDTNITIYHYETGTFVQKAQFDAAQLTGLGFGSNEADYLFSSSKLLAAIPYEHLITPGDIVNYAYRGAVYDTTNDRVWLIPNRQAPELFWHYIDCATETVASYLHGATAVLSAYDGGVYDATNDRIWMIPGNQAPELFWHYIDCATGTIVSYAHGAIAAVGAYSGGVYDPENDRIWMIPYGQADQPTWHYIDCATSTVVSYAHGATAVNGAYAGGAYDPINKRVWFCPYEQASEVSWHFINCTAGTIHAYVHGATVLQWGYQGAVYDPINERIYMAPQNQADQAEWHYIDVNTKEVVAFSPGIAVTAWAYIDAIFVPDYNIIIFIPDELSYLDTWHYFDCNDQKLCKYVHGSLEDTLNIASAYYGGALDGTGTKLYLAASKQVPTFPPDPDPEIIDPKTFWHYIKITPIMIYKRTGLSWAIHQILKTGFNCLTMDAFYPYIIGGNSDNADVRIWQQNSTTELWEQSDSFLGTDAFGCAVSICNDFSAVGDTTNTTVSLYKRTGNLWNKTEDIVVSGLTEFGKAVRVRVASLGVLSTTHDGSMDCSTLSMYTINSAGSATLLNDFMNYEGSGNITPLAFSADFLGDIFVIGAPEGWQRDGGYYSAAMNVGYVAIVQKFYDYTTTLSYGTYSSGSASSTGGTPPFGGGGGSGSAGQRKYRDITLWRPYKPG